MGNTVSREHAKLPFAYTHARREDHVWGSPAFSSSWRRQRLAHRLLLIKNSDNASVTPFPPFRSGSSTFLDNSQAVADGPFSATGFSSGAYADGTGAAPTFATMPFSTSSTSLSAMSTGSDNEEVVSLSSILHQGPESKWHSLDLDMDQLEIATYAVGGDSCDYAALAEDPSPQPTPPLPPMPLPTPVSAMTTGRDLRSTKKKLFRSASCSRSRARAADPIVCLDKRLDLGQGPGAGVAGSGPEHVRRADPETAVTLRSSSAMGSRPRPAPDAAPDATTSKRSSTTPGPSNSSRPSTTSPASSSPTFGRNALNRRRGSLQLPLPLPFRSNDDSNETLAVPRPRSSAQRNTIKRLLHSRQHLYRLDSDSEESFTGIQEDSRQDHCHNRNRDNNVEEDIGDGGGDMDDDNDGDDNKVDNDDQDHAKLDLISALGIEDPSSEAIEVEPFAFFDAHCSHTLQNLTSMQRLHGGIPPDSLYWNSGFSGSAGSGPSSPWRDPDEDEIGQPGSRIGIDEFAGLGPPPDYPHHQNHHSSHHSHHPHHGMTTESEPGILGGRWRLGSRRGSRSGPPAGPLSGSGSMNALLASAATAAAANTAGAWMYGSDGLLPYLPMTDEDVSHLSPLPFSELPNLSSIGLCGHGIVRLSRNIRLLTSATCLQICCNDLCSIPVEIGCLRNLTLLDLSKNSLTQIPDSIRYLTKLVDLKLAFNFIEVLPASIGELVKLTSLTLASNRLVAIPSQIGQLKSLANLDFSDNPLTVLPAEIGRLQMLKRLRVDRCPLQQEFVHSPLHSPPSLLELAARVIVRRRRDLFHDSASSSTMGLLQLLPPHLKSYLRTAKKCSFCDGPYFETSYKRGKMMEKNDHLIPLEYTLCTPHWNTEMERVRLLFCARPITAPPAFVPSPPAAAMVMTAAVVQGTPGGATKQESMTSSYTQTTAPSSRPGSPFSQFRQSGSKQPLAMVATDVIVAPSSHLAMVSPTLTTTSPFDPILHPQQQSSQQSPSQLPGLGQNSSQGHGLGFRIRRRASRQELGTSSNMTGTLSSSSSFPSLTVATAVATTTEP
ncbi:hypothetical protein BGW38_005291, partial [Lunasporangiospora selenospora]